MVNNGYNSLICLYNNVFLLFLNKNTRKSKIFTATVLNWDKRSKEETQTGNTDYMRVIRYR